MNEKRLIIFGLILAFVYRFLVIYNTKVTFFSDDAIYVSLARFFWEGNISHAFHPTWPPLFPFLSAFSFFLLRNWEVSLQLISVISGTLVFLPIYLLFKQAFSQIKSVIISLLIISLTPFLWNSAYPMSDMLALFFIQSSITASFIGIHKAMPKYFLFSSVLLGLLFLTRSEGTMFFGITSVYLSVFLLFNTIVKKRFSKKTLLILPAFTLVFFAVASPYIISTKIQLGEWTLSQKFSAQVKQGHSFELRKGTTWSQEAVSIRNPNYTSEYFRGGTWHLLDYSDWFVWWFWEKLGKWQKMYVVTTPIWFWVFAFLGSLKVFTKKHFWSLGYLLACLFIGVILTIFSTPLVEIRYLLWVVPLLVYIFSLGVDIVFTKLKKRSFGTIITLIAITQLPLFKLDFAINPIFFAHDLTRTMNWEETRIAGEWIKQNKDVEVPKIMMRHEGVEFYASGETIYMPQIPYDQILEYAKSHGVDYIVAWDKEIAGDKEVSVLLNPNKSHVGLIKVFQTENIDPKIIIYELKY